MFSRALLLFGSTGDLAKRKLFPALFSLYISNQLKDTKIIAVGRKPMSNQDFFHDFVKVFLKDSPQIQLDAFAGMITYVTTSEWWSEIQKNLSGVKEVSAYLSIPPEAFFDTAQLVKTVAPHEAKVRIAFEKPFGHDLKSAQKLNQELQSLFEEDDIYRVDHYVGKEAIQNILAFRFSNPIFEHIWNHHYIDNIQITASESLALEGRAGYYDGAGAIRDMIQNHLFQTLSLVAMEAPVSLESARIHDEKVKVIRSVRIPSNSQDKVILGQYDGYLSEIGVKPNSSTETFVAMQLELQNSRFFGVPIYLRTGKALKEKKTSIVVEFKKPLHLLFALESPMDYNRIVFDIFPHTGISVGFHVKSPGESRKVQPVWSRFTQEDEGMEAYEKILLDFLLGDKTLFARSDIIEESWKVVDELVHCREKCPKLHSYAIGSSGPIASEELLSSSGRKWF